MELKTRYKWYRPELLLSVLVMFLWSAKVVARQAGDSFKTGNELYAKGKYLEAISSYEKLTKTGYRSAALYFNLGNAFYRVGNIPSAILYYEKAHKLDPGDEDIKMNLAIANLKTIDKIEAVPDFFLFRWWRGLILLLSIDTLAWLSILFILSGCTLLVWYLFAGTVQTKKRSFFSGLVMIFAGLLFIFMANRQSHYFSATRQAIVMSASCTVKSNPSASATTVFVIHSGTKVDLASQEEGWIRVKLVNGNIGWVQKKDIQLI